MILSEEALIKVKDQILGDDDPAITGVRADIVLSIIETAQARQVEIERQNEARPVSRYAASRPSNQRPARDFFSHTPAVTE